MSEGEEDDHHRRVKQALEKLKKLCGELEREDRERVRSFTVNKRTHRVRFEGETEDEVTVVIEPK